eukprot:g2119.t1
MGGCLGVAVPVPDERVAKVIDEIDLKKKHLQRLWKLFCKYDEDRSGTIDTEEFYKMVEEEPSLFGDSIFELIDVNNNGTLDFGEFVQALSTFCMFGKDDILKFCFYIFDKDRNGFINSDELQDLVGLLHKYSVSNIESVMREIGSQKDNRITFKQFKVLNETYPFVLYPAFRIHFTLQKVTLGSMFWDEMKRKKKIERDQDTFEQGKADREMEAYRLSEIARMKREKLKSKMGSLQYYVCYYITVIDKLPLVQIDEDLIPSRRDESKTKQKKKEKHRRRRGDRVSPSAHATGNSKTRTLEQIEKAAQRRKERKQRRERQRGRERRSKRNKSPKRGKNGGKRKKGGRRERRQKVENDVEIVDL